MLSQDEFTYLMIEAAKFSGQRPDKEMVRLIYERIKQEVTTDDVRRGLDKLTEQDHRLTGPTILKFVRIAAAERREKEQAAKQRRDDFAFANWKAAQKEPIARDHADMICRIINKEIDVIDAHRELAKLYPGIGHENYIPEMQPF